MQFAPEGSSGRPDVQLVYTVFGYLPPGVFSGYLYPVIALGLCANVPQFAAELSMGWVETWVGLGRVHYSASTKNLKGLC